MIKKAQQGFTLIELMIVVAIIGILAAVAIPAYQDYVVKAKLSKVMATIDPVKMATAMYLQENGDLPSAADSWVSLGLVAGGPTLTTEVTAISQAANTGALTLTLGNIKATTINGLTVTMTPSVTAGQTAVVWSNTCTVTDPIAIKYFGC